MDISNAFKLMQHWPELKRAYALWNQIKTPFTQMIDILRSVGGDVGLLDEPLSTRQAIEHIKSSPLGRFNVEWVQETLTIPGIPGGSPDLKVDGKMGPATVAAIKTFQSAHPPLAADGWAGLQTLAAMEMDRKRLGYKD